MITDLPEFNLKIKVPKRVHRDDVLKGSVHAKSELIFVFIKSSLLLCDVIILTMVWAGTTMVKLSVDT